MSRGIDSTAGEWLVQDVSLGKLSVERKFPGQTRPYVPPKRINQQDLGG